MRVTDDYVFFWDGVFSNWYPCKFTINDIEYNCVEQWMMAQKASMFGDDYIYEKIMRSTNPSEHKKLGRRVNGFSQHEWSKVSRDIVYNGVYAKFDQNEKLREQLIMLGQNRRFVEASPYDLIWGIGLSQDDDRCLDPKNWRGTNWLGEALNKVYLAIRTK